MLLLIFHRRFPEPLPVGRWKRKRSGLSASSDAGRVARFAWVYTAREDPFPLLIWRRGLGLCSVPGMPFPYLPRRPVLRWNSDSRELQLARYPLCSSAR